MTQRFKAGDKVYYPKKSNKVLTLLEGGENSRYTVLVKFKDTSTMLISQSFMPSGKEDVLDAIPSIFHATPENKEKLELLYGVKLDSPCITPSEIVQRLLLNHQFVACYVSDTNPRPNPTCWAMLVKDVESFESSDGSATSYRHIDTIGSAWCYVTPFDLKTGRVICDIDENGDIVLGQDFKVTIL